MRFFTRRAFGSSNEPTDLGSAGGMSPALPGFSQGGGAVSLLVYGALTVNGSISANGNSDELITGAGGGSGGSIWITAQSLAGNGSLSANGGAGETTDGGGGGGGRIAVYATSNQYSGAIVVAGGSGSTPGESGTIFTATNLTVSGYVTDTNGDGISGVTLSATGASPVVSDATGFYSIDVPLFWTGTDTPSGTGTIIPSFRQYFDLVSDSSNQDFIVTSSAAFVLGGAQCDGTNMSMSYYTISGATYQLLCSTDLVNWAPYGYEVSGNNCTVTYWCPATNAPQMFFRLNVTY